MYAIAQLSAEYGELTAAAAGHAAARRKDGRPAETADGTKRVHAAAALVYGQAGRREPGPGIE